MSQKERRLNIKSNFCLLLSITKAKFFRDLDLKFLAYFLRRNYHFILSICIPHLHSNYIILLSNLSNNPVPSHIIRVNCLILNSQCVLPTVRGNLSVCCFYLHIPFLPTQTSVGKPQTDNVCLLPKDKGSKMFSTQLKELLLSNHSDDAE